MKPYNFLHDGNAQPMVFAWMPALSLYFRDPDGHELEFIAILEGEARPERIEKLQPKAPLPMPILLLADETVAAVIEADRDKGFVISSPHPLLRKRRRIFMGRQKNPLIYAAH